MDPWMNLPVDPTLEAARGYPQSQYTDTNIAAMNRFLLEPQSVRLLGPLGPWRVSDILGTDMHVERARRKLEQLAREEDARRMPASVSDHPTKPPQTALEMEGQPKSKAKAERAAADNSTNKSE
jgi:hypothetical protein